MRIRMFAALGAVVLLSGSPVGVDARTDDTAQACAASLAVLRNYTKDFGHLAVLDMDAERTRSVPPTWNDPPSAVLARRWVAGPSQSFAATCANGPGPFTGLGVVDQEDPRVTGYLTLGLARLSVDSREALVEAGYANKGFGGHCALYHLRRDTVGWRIVDQRATCVI